MNVVRNIVRVPLTTPQELVTQGLVPPDHLEAISQAAETLPVAITGQMAGLIEADDRNDPIARQFVPDPRENIAGEAELGDPIGDQSHSPVPGIVHRYPDRVLLMPVMTCPVYCRFCFRREAVANSLLAPDALDRALDYIRDHKEIWEVILSGGDPLILSPRRLGDIIQALDKIDHVGVIRIHSRVPVVAPERVTEPLLASLATETALYVVLHCNHARELAPAAQVAIKAIVTAGIPMLSQSVLLKGINDDEASMTALMRALTSLRIKPYYLHHGDLARGTGHFRTTLEAGRSLMRSLRGKLSGLCQPTYVLDIPGGHGKSPVGPEYLRAAPDGRWMIEDWRGNSHPYDDETGSD
jgi:lysine 2,3-aminomutase